ncbi:CarD family transcriptional regulator [Clostridium sp. CTA-5]
MFNVGDIVVYPNQGVGMVDVIEERTFKGEAQSYYKIHLFNNTMKLTLPCSKAEISNIRLISDSKILDNNLKNINEFVTNIDDLNKSNFKERAAINNTKIKSGTLEDYLEVFCNLTQIKIQHQLNSSEKDMLRKTKRMLIEEISQSKNLSNDEASNLLDKSVAF